MASLVQGTSTLEMQRLDKENVNNIISMYEKKFLGSEYKNKLRVNQFNKL